MRWQTIVMIAVLIWCAVMVVYASSEMVDWLYEHVVWVVEEK